RFKRKSERPSENLPLSPVLGGEGSGVRGVGPRKHSPSPQPLSPKRGRGASWTDCERPVPAEVLLMTQPTCPDVRSWQDLLEGGGAGGEREELAQHLEACAACQHTLETLAAEPAVWEDAARALGEQQGQAGREPALQDLVERLKREQPPAVEEDLSFLRPADKPGLLGLLGPYEVREVIGRGGMGVVLKAFEPALHRVVAIKVMAAALAGNATARRRFTREAQAAAAVSHDHVVAVHGVSEAGGLPYLVMQYVAGESLQARLDRAEPLEVAEVVRIGLQTAAGLAAAHAQ